MSQTSVKKTEKWKLEWKKVTIQCRKDTKM